MLLDVQFNAATTPWPELRDAILIAEAEGYGVAWVLDHMAGQVMGGDAMLECFTTTGALAAVTSTIGIGTLVANVWNRPLAVLAAAAATAQTISDGRFWLGIGAGASPTSPYGAEHTAVGIELSPAMVVRQQRVTDFIAMTRTMWQHGEYNGVSGFPMPPSPIPLFVGVNSVALAEIAAREADGINVRSNHDRLDAIVDAARRARPPGMPPLVITTWCRMSNELRDPASPEMQRFERIGIDRLIVVQFDRVDFDLIRR